MTSLVTPERLATLFRPRSIAFVGASDKSLFSRMAYSNVERFGFAERTVLVNPRSPEVHGRPTVPSLVGIDHEVDAALMMVPRAAMLDSLDELAAAGVRNALVLSADYAEAGEEGKEAQRALAERAEAHGMLLLGPNHLGFANLVDGIPVIGMPDFDSEPGDVALISQSGGSVSSMAQFAAMVGVRFSYLVTLGNEAMITAGNVLEFMIEDPATKAVAMFVEAVRDPAAVRRAAARARELGKPIVVLKAGASVLAARTAVAHTGALVGDDAVTDAVFAELGIIRVDTIEDMIVTAGAAAHLGRLPEGGVGVVAHSGGACDIIADSAERHGMPIAELGTSTVEKLRDLLPAYAAAQNPLDVTGAGVNDPSVMAGSIVAMGADPAVSVVAVVNSLPWTDDDAWSREPMTRGIGAGMQAAASPSVFVNQVTQPVSERTRAIMRETGIDWVIPGIDHATIALAAIGRWSRALDAPAVVPETPPGIAELASDARADSERAWSEDDARRLLDRAGVPAVPSTLARTEDEAAEAASRWPGPLAVKLVSPDVAHKSDIGGVRLGVSGEDAAREAYRAVVEAGRRIPGARVDGALVSPQRDPGPELIVGVTVDAVWGPVLALGFGGVYAELLRDVVLVPLPAGPDRIRAAVERLRGLGILTGARGGPATDLDELARVASRFGALALELGDRLESFEINPLRASRDGWEALDALVVWRDR